MDTEQISKGIRDYYVNLIGEPDDKTTERFELIIERTVSAIIAEMERGKPYKHAFNIVTSKISRSVRIR